MRDEELGYARNCYRIKSSDPNHQTEWMEVAVTCKLSHFTAPYHCRIGIGHGTPLTGFTGVPAA
jgi:hypothetical protein